jgi:hypothetical protein
VPGWPLPTALPAFAALLAFAELYGVSAGDGDALITLGLAQSSGLPEDWGLTAVGATTAGGGVGRATTTGGVMMLAEDEGCWMATVELLPVAW